MVTKARTSLNLSSRERTAVRDFLTAVRMAYGENIQYTALFGSRVRGDSLQNSDIDVLLIVTDDHWKVQQSISKISSEVSLK